MNRLKRPLSKHRLWLVAIAPIAACNPMLGEVGPRERKYESRVRYAEETERPMAGSLWTANAGGNYAFRDHRAQRQGDLVMILVSENADARRGAATETSRNSEMSNAITDIGAVLKYLQPGLSGAELAGGKSESDFSGSGTTSRTEKLTARVTATVKMVLPNGNLFVEGEREVLVNRESNVLYVSGVIRPIDIGDDNTIESARLADAQIEFNGRGVISDKQGPGALQRVMDQYGPF
jgi:flagellar L-ring protein precursor FlgH